MVNKTQFIDNIKDNLSIIIVVCIGVIILIIGLWLPFISFLLAVLMGVGVVLWMMCSLRGF